MPSSSNTSEIIYSRSELFSLNGQVSIVMGGSGDIGRTIASALAVNGSHVVIVGTSPEKLQTAKMRIRELLEKEGVSGPQIETRNFDIRDEKAVEALAEDVFKEYGRIDVLVNAQGTNVRMPTVDYPLETWERVVDVNLKGTYIACRAVGKYMIKQGHGKIINISSTAAPSGYKWGYPAYSPSKAGVDALTRTLAVEWGKHGINVNSIAPYMVLTSLTSKFLQDPDVSSDVLHDIPLGRIGNLGDLVGVALFLASGASKWMTGQVVYVDGGYMAH